MYYENILMFFLLARQNLSRACVVIEILTVKLEAHELTHAERNHEQNMECLERDKLVSDTVKLRRGI